MKIRIIVCAAAALLVLISASIWEGAVSIAPAGELPDEGYYAATNSFPRNTVVDILNLETGKSVRVIVAAGLETPGLLAVLSREAADIIGLRPRSIGRIRMTQPSDPVAFSRFTEGLTSNGDPDYDPRALVASDPRASALINDPAAGESPLGGTAAPAPETEPPPPGSGDSGYDESGYYDEIVDISGFYTPPAASLADGASPSDGASPLDEASSTDEASSNDEGIIREPDAAWVYAPEEDETIAESGEPAENPAENLAEGPAEEAETPEEWRFTEAEEKPEALELPVPEAAAAGEAGLPETPETTGEETYDYSLVPAEERPPEESPDYTLPPEAEISSLPERRDPGEPETAGTGTLDESLFIAPIERTAAEPEYPEIFVTPPEPSLFSVPVIDSLERGKYYLQLGAFSRPESAEAELNRIGNTYPLAVQNGGSPEKPVYRVLVGPINLGESGALLQRFKSIGYTDAFVRSGS